MKKIINGKKYDTDTATQVAEWSKDVSVSDFTYFEETLYKKRSGEYFLYGFGNAASKYAVPEDDGWRGGSTIMPLSYENACKWAEEHMDADDYEAEFGEVSEDDSKMAICLSVRTDTAEILRKAAAASGVSVSEYVDRLVHDMDKK